MPSIDSASLLADFNRWYNEHTTKLQSKTLSIEIEFKGTDLWYQRGWKDASKTMLIEFKNFLHHHANLT